MAIGQCIYSKSLRLAHEQRAAFGTGAITSFMQVDAQKLGQSVTYAHCN